MIDRRKTYDMTLEKSKKELMSNSCPMGDIVAIPMNKSMTHLDGMHTKRHTTKNEQATQVICKQRSEVNGMHAKD